VRVALVNIADMASSDRRVPLVCPPLGLAYLAGALREGGHDPVLVDGVGAGFGRFTAFLNGTFLHGLPVDELVERVPADVALVGIGVMFSDYWPLAKRVAAALRARFPRVPIVFGGEHPSACPRFCLEDSCADFVVVGEGEETLCELADALSLEPGDPARKPLDEIGSLVRRTPDGVVATPRRRRLRRLDDLPWPAWDLVELERYLDANLGYGVAPGRRSMVMLGTRGCPYTCKFCSNEGMWGTQYFRRDPADVVDEMEHYVARYGARDFQFHDLTFVVNHDWCLRVAREIRDRGLDVTWQLISGTRSEALDAELLRAMSSAGCHTIYLAPESGSSRILDVIRKRVDLGKILSVARTVKRERIPMRVGAFIIYGFPEERFSDVLRTWWLLLRMLAAGFDVVDSARFSAYPGSEYHDEALRAGRIRYDDDYFLSLQRRPGLAGASWHPRWSGRTIFAFQLVHYAIYLTGYFLVRPRRIADFLDGVLGNRPKTRFERFFAYALWQPLRRRRP
jgi:radical SAM superfamily enzyme YgiQ (UPF0313 family)